MVVSYTSLLSYLYSLAWKALSMYSSPDFSCPSEKIDLELLETLGPVQILEMLEEQLRAAENGSHAPFSDDIEVDCEEEYDENEDESAEETLSHDEAQQYIIDSLTIEHGFVRLGYESYIKDRLDDKALFGLDFSPRRGIQRWVSNVVIKMIKEAEGDLPTSLSYISQSLEVLEEHGVISSFDFNGGFSFTYHWNSKGNPFDECPENGITISLAGLDLKKIAKAP